jgi:hypothetical protein
MMTPVLKVFLWLSVIASSMGLGAKAFDLMVLATAWGAAPPESLTLMPYGPRYTLDPGDFFIPISILLLVGYFGALISGWRNAGNYRVALVVPVIMIMIMAAITPTVFWPMIRELYGAGIGRGDADAAHLAAVVQRWFVLDILRTCLVAVSLTCHVYLINKLNGSDKLT